MNEQDKVGDGIGTWMIALGTLVGVAGLVGGAYFGIQAANACQSFYCETSEQIAERQYTTLAVYCFIGGVVSGSVLAVLGEISQNIAIVANRLAK